MDFLFPHHPHIYLRPCQQMRKVDPKRDKLNSISLIRNGGFMPPRSGLKNKKRPPIRPANGGSETTASECFSQPLKNS
jgi:hypothetical protein